jgi:hypothetical protein
VNPQTTNFQVTRLQATVPDGVPLEYQGRRFSSGPLTIELDVENPSCGFLDYSCRRAKAEFHVRMQFSEFAETLLGLGADISFTNPVRATLHSQGDILDDHSFYLSGPCELLPHELFRPNEAAATVLPGH